MNAIQILEELFIYYSWLYETSLTKDWERKWSWAMQSIEKAIEKIRELPPTISQEDINKLQRYDHERETEWGWMEESDEWEYVRYDSLISLLTK